MKTLVMNTTCPHCGKVHDRQTGFASESPANGDVAICMDCGELSVFDLDANCLRLPTVDQKRHIDSIPDIDQYRAAWRETAGKKLQ